MPQLPTVDPGMEPAMEYELRDAAGRPIGQVLQPAGVPLLGPGAETVLLVRASAAPGRRTSSAA